MQRGNVYKVHSKITFFIARNVIMIGLYHRSDVVKRRCGGVMPYVYGTWRAEHPD